MKTTLFIGCVESSYVLLEAMLEKGYKVDGIITMESSAINSDFKSLVPLAEKYGIQAERAASLMDTTSCCIQGMIPYGAQILIAAALSASIGMTSFAILKGLFYPALMLLGLFFSISGTKDKAKNTGEY